MGVAQLSWWDVDHGSETSSAEAHCARKYSVPDILNARAADRMAEPAVVRISCAGSGWLRVEWLGVKAEVDQTSIDEEKGEHWKLMAVHYLDQMSARKSSICGFKERSWSGVGREGVQSVLGHLKKQSMECVISKKTVDYTQKTSYIPPTICHRPKHRSRRLDNLCFPRKVQIHYIWLIQAWPCARWTLSSQRQTCLDCNMPAVVTPILAAILESI